MCPSLNDRDLYFYYVAEKYKRISEDWNTFEYVIFTLMVSVIVFIWCDIVSEHEKQACNNPCREICGRCEEETSSGCRRKKRVIKRATQTCGRFRTPSPPVRRSLRLLYNNANSPPIVPLNKMTKTINSNNKSPNRCCCLVVQRSRSPIKPLRRSLRLQRNAIECSGAGSSNSIASKVSIRSSEITYCGQWCKRRALQRAREEDRKKRSKSRTRRER